MSDYIVCWCLFEAYRRIPDERDFELLYTYFWVESVECHLNTISAEFGNHSSLR